MANTRHINALFSVQQCVRLGGLTYDTAAQPEGAGGITGTRPGDATRAQFMQQRNGWAVQ